MVEKGRGRARLGSCCHGRRVCDVVAKLRVLEVEFVSLTPGLAGVTAAVACGSAIG